MFRRGGELLTMFESFLVQVRVRGGFPTQTQVRVTSEPMSVVVGLGSTTIRGATEAEREKHRDGYKEEWTAAVAQGTQLHWAPCE